MVSVVDERSAGFFALGVGKATGTPAAVITTSGTAGANLYPAVVEASQGEVPLLVLTADRPHRLRDTDGNQAMDQIRLFGSFPRAFIEVAPATAGDAELKHLRGQACRAVALTVGSPPGPVHLNLPFEKPLEPQGSAPETEGISPLALRGREGNEPFVRVASRRPGVDREETDRVRDVLSASPRGLIVAGPSTGAGKGGAAVVALSAATGFPLLADPLSGARFLPHPGAHVVAGYDLFLRSEEARVTLRPDVILRVGASPTSAAALDYLRDHEAVPQVVVDDGHRWKDHTASAHAYVRTSPSDFLSALALEVPHVVDADWKALWERAEERTLAVVDAQSRDELLEGWILEALTEILPEDANLLVASSMPIRDLDAFGRPRAERLNVLGNRGTSGIDGLVSTTLGLGMAREGPTVGVLGDLAFLHDMNGLLTLKQERFPVGFVVVNNDGGGIFHTLPVRAFEPAFTRYFATPHGLDLGRVADLYGLPFQRADTLVDLRRSLPTLLGSGEPFVLEVPTRREEGHARRREIQQAVERAVAGMAGTRARILRSPSS
jgi:2-succinyl-5-enolpyruvyl-6-hydroxy-3-cyclohexene-1-carboxylate synthase